MKRVLISGYYGFDNAGDEAVLAGLITGLRRSIDSAAINIEVLSINPGRTASLHQVDAAHRYKNFLKPIASADLLCSGGGSLLQDVTSAYGIFYYLAIVRLAQILGRKTMFIAQGVGPLNNARSRKLTASVANRLDAITVRDTQSADLLRSIGVWKEIIVTADPALLLEPTTTIKEAPIQLSMRPWVDTKLGLASRVAEAIRASAIPTNIEPLNMYGSGDNLAVSAVLDRLPQVSSPPSQRYDAQDFRQLLNQVSNTEMVVGMRLHALIFAAACGVPSVALSYDPKVVAFMQQSGQSDAIFHIESDSAKKLSEILDYVWTNRSARRPALLERIRLLRLAAQKNADIATALL